jgi:hypothetical protein
MTLVLNGGLVEAIEQSEVDVLHSRLSAIKGINGNPMDVDIQKFGNATAFSVKNIPGPSFNLVKGFRDGDEKVVSDIIDYYHGREIPVRFELTPAHASPALLTYLSEVGFYQNDFKTTLYAELSSEIKSIDPQITLRRLKRNEFELYAEIYVKGFQMPEFLKDGIAQNNEVLYDNDNWNFFLASINEEPAGIGVLFNGNGIATLAAAATVPDLRSKGVHTAFIQERINQAKLLNCTLVVGQAKFASVSQNNMERAGMKVAYTRAIWVKR